MDAIKAKQITDSAMPRTALSHQNSEYLCIFAKVLKTKNKETLQMFPLKIHTCVKSTFECKTNIPCT